MAALKAEADKQAMSAYKGQAHTLKGQHQNSHAYSKTKTAEYIHLMYGTYIK